MAKYELKRLFTFWFRAYSLEITREFPDILTNTYTSEDTVRPK
jgi:hypothetical protein